MRDDIAHRPSLLVPRCQTAFAAEQKPCGLVEHYPANVFASGDQGLDFAVGPAAIKSAELHVGEVQTVALVHARSLDQSISGRQSFKFHSIGPPPQR